MASPYPAPQWRGSSSYHQHENPAVCDVPKLFVGQIPFEATTEQVQALFQQYGVIKSCQVITGQDGRSKGCAMIMFTTFSEAEKAIEGEHGTTHLGGTRPLVVRLADPPRRGDGPVVGIAPKKLFVGQIPQSMTDESLRSMFSPYGNVVEVHVLKKSMGSGCAFVTFESWSGCEEAIAALHGKTQLDGAKMPMVVKFADAKVPHMDNGFGPGSKRVYDPNSPGVLGAAAVAGAMAGAAVSKKQAYASMAGGYPYPMPGYGMGMGGPMPGMGGMPGYGMGMMGMGMGIGMQPGMGMGMGMRPGMGPMGGKMPGGPGAGNPAMQTSKMGAGMVDEASKAWKLFVGQVPFDSNEPDLWPIFSSVGVIQELVILRTPQGKSKGCAFVTYQTKDMAEKAIQQLDGKAMVPGDPKQRLLIVKFAGAGNSPSSGNTSSGQQPTGTAPTTSGGTTNTSASDMTTAPGGYGSGGYGDLSMSGQAGHGQEMYGQPGNLYGPGAQAPAGVMGHMQMGAHF